MEQTDIYYSNEILAEVIETLEWCKWNHYQSGVDGQSACGWFFGEGCDCGADEINEVIQVAINKLESLIQ